MISMCLYFDDILPTRSCTSEMRKFKKVLMNAFEMIGLGNVIYFLGMEIFHSEKGIVMNQLKYEVELLKRFELMNCKIEVTPSETNHKLDFDSEGDDVDATTFKQLVGYLGYLCNIKPDICYVVGTASRFMSKPKWYHYQAVVRILRHVKGTLKHRILFPSRKSDDVDLIGCSDSDWYGDRVDRRSTIGYLLKYLGV